jgi:hypothetical protein
VKRRSAIIWARNARMLRGAFLGLLIFFSASRLLTAVRIGDRGDLPMDALLLGVGLYLWFVSIRRYRRPERWER